MKTPLFNNQRQGVVVHCGRTMNIDNGSIQVIDGDKVFNPELLSYLSKYYQADDDSGLNYHIVSVFGSQSTGKSTLLNHLFGTQFDVMNETQRQQTTKGIWLAHANRVANKNELESTVNGNIFVMDVEGTDGRERGEDQDFERKSALFALSTSEVLIVNIWEHQVGLYHGANMGLLKTVFEVNLSLFSQNRQKSCLLFVIRDHIGVTPLENLSNTLTEDLNKIWSQLSKPPGTEDSKISDFFDLKFWALPHKLLQMENFIDGVQNLGDEFLTANKLFQNDYHRNIPIDGWSIYAGQIWEQIELNKDLDLPTQQILVARFRCDEIANEAYKSFELDFENLQISEDLKSFGDVVKKLRFETLSNYDTNASRYTKSAFEQRRKLLVQKIDLAIKELFSNVISSISKKTVVKFVENVSENKKEKDLKFITLLTLAMDNALNYFRGETSYLSIKDDDNVEVLNNEKELIELTTKLNDLANQEKEKELETVTSKILKKFNNSFKDVVFDNLSDPNEESWDKILQEFNELVDSLTNKYNNDGTFDFGLELSADLNIACFNKIRKKCWLQFDHIIHNYITEDNVLNILRNKFDEYFRYDEQGLPKLWETTLEIDKYFTEARGKTLELLPILSIAKLSGNIEILPDVEINQEDYDEDEEDEDHRFAHLLTLKQEQSIITKFKKQIDLIYMDAKRSIVQSRTSIPPYFYLLLIVLGWNEMMAVLRSPILFTLLLLALLGFYLAYNMQMLGPLMHLSITVLDQTKKMLKEKLKDILIDEDHKKSNEGFNEKASSLAT